jgi:mono/diheme cytochrome c family protein
MLLRLVSYRVGVLSAVVTLLFVACNTNAPAADKETENSISRGQYLVTVGGCNDCHSPKKLTPQGPVVDSARLLSGHPAGLPLPPFDVAALTPGHWIGMAPTLTAYAGPWGISYATNLTPDSTTGIGVWTEDMFVKSIQTGKHLGMETGRPILPPMPWEEMAQWKENDLRAVYRYLRSLPPIRNQVPAPMSPEDAARLAGKNSK